jgi:hypothetical protein
MKGKRMSKEYRRTFFKEVALLFEKYPNEISEESKQYLKWIRNIGYLDPRSSEFAFKDRYKKEW